MGWIEMNEKTKKAQKTKAASLADRYSFGHKALSVVLSVVLLGFGWPAVNPAEVFANDDAAAQSEVAQTQESATGATDVPAAQQAESASSEQAVEASSANQAADANTATTTSAAAASEQPATQPSQPSANKAASADAAAQAKSEYDIALELNNASIKKADGTDTVISLPATKVTVPAGAGFKFTVVPDNGYKLNRVLVNVGGQQSPLAADDAGVYAIEASAFEAGVTITLETEKDEAAAQPTAPAQPITDSSVESGSTGEADGSDTASADEASNADSNGTANKEESNADDEQAPEQNGTGSLLDSISGFFPAFGGNASVASNVSGNAGNTINAKVGDKVILDGTSNTGSWWGDCGYPHSWGATGDNKNAVTINGSGESVSVTFAKAGTYTIEHTYCKKEHSWGGHNTDNETFTVIVSDNSVTNLTISGASSVNQFKTTQLTANASDVTWTSSDSSIATIDASGKVTGVAEGKVTITATAITAEGKVLTATHEVTVTKSSAQTNSAKLFFLKSPTNNPDSNSAGDWFPTGGSSDLNVKVNVDGATWSGGVNTWDNVANRVVSWPDGSTGATWTLPRANSYWSQVFNNYKEEIQNNQGVSITEDDVEAIILHPYKISNNSGVYHLDCKVEIKVNQVKTATFWIQSPGATGFDKQYSVLTFKVKDGVVQVVAPEAPEEEKTVDGTKYKFMGWYSDQACTQKVTFPVTTSENVYYYGKYVPCDQSIQVNYYLEGTTTPVAPSKTLAGYMKGQTVTQKPIDIPGYTPVSGEAKKGVVGTDASIDFYYTANTVKYRVEYYWNGSNEPFETFNASGKYGDTISASPKSFSGYTAVSNDAKSLKLSVDEGKNIVKFYYYKNVTLTANSGTKAYNGQEQSVDGYTTNLPEGTTASFDGVTLNGGKGTNAGDYAYTFADGTVGKVSTDNNYIVTELNPGNLRISPVNDEVTVTITGHKDGEKYNGEEQTVEGYDVSGLPSGVSEGDIAFTGSAEVKATDAGTYPMNLNEKQFSLTGDAAKNYTNVKFVVTDGELKIDKRAVTLTSEDGHKNYDGKTLQRRTNLTVSGDGFVGNDGVLAKDKLTWYDENNILPGTYENKFDPAYTEGTNLDNYEVTLKFGELVVNARSDKDKYQIPVTAKSDSKSYTGNEHSVSGLDGTTFINDKGAAFTVEGLSASVSATDAGEYDNKVVGTAVVKDAQGNDVTSEFEVTTENGSLDIAKATVTMKSASDEWTYDGNEHTKHEMEFVKGFAEGEGATFAYTGAITNVGEVNNTYTYTLNANTSADNYTFADPEYGTLKVNPVTDKVTVTIKGKQETKAYNGSEQSVTGYDFSADNGLYAQGDVKFTGTATAKGVAVGTYNMNLAKNQFSNTNKNFSNVEFVVEDGWLKIEGGEIDQNGVVWNTHDNQKVYEGTPLAAYAATATDKHGNALNVEYSIDGKTWTSDPSQITITHFGYQVVQLRATGSNYAEGQYATSFESIAITKRLVTLTSEGGNKPYDGTPLTNGTVTATAKGEGVGFIDGEGVSFNVTGSQTEKGESDNTFTYTFNEGTSEADYWVITKPGKLIVTADENEVVVTITENGGNVEYDGTEKSVSGYEFSASNELYKKSDFTFSGNDTVKGTNVGTYDMELKPSDFTNNNQNFSKVTFVVVDGQLNITPKDIKTGENMKVEAPANVTYNGQLQQEDPVVKDGDKALVKNVDYTLSYSKDTTNVGTVTVTVTGKGNYSGSADVEYQILKRSVVLESATDSKLYDGTALTGPNVTVEGDGFVDGEVTNVRATGSVTTVAEGEVVNTIVYDEGVNFKAGNYDITKKEGKLSITALSAEDGLVITPNNAEYTYNAESHSAGLASARASVDGTNVSLEYRVEGSPDTGWRSNVSEITAINAGTVTIEVRASADNYSGYKHAKQTLTINKRDVELTSASASKVYDGTALTKDWVDMGPNRADTGFIWSDPPTTARFMRLALKPWLERAKTLSRTSSKMALRAITTSLVNTSAPLR